jgi:hypothetical protein
MAVSDRFFLVRPNVSSSIAPLRTDEATLRVHDDAAHGTTAWAIGLQVALSGRPIEDRATGGLSHRRVKTGL